jgi:hypothetical protein
MTTENQVGKYLKNNVVDKIFFACKEADCTMNCKISVNVSTSLHKYVNEFEFPTLCPFHIMNPIWKYEGMKRVRYKIDEEVIHG